MGWRSRNEPTIEGSLTTADLPLGPWAGEQVTVWASKTGTTWHANPDCPKLVSKAKTAAHQQPGTGTFGQRAVPAQLHCNPPGELAAYAVAIHELIRFDQATRSAAQKLEADALALDVLMAGSPQRHLEPSRQPYAELSARWKTCVKERSELLDELREQLTDRLPVMLAASWVASGRTPRQHQQRYAAFVDIAEDICDRHEISANGSLSGLINHRYLSIWLNRVAKGGHPRRMTRDLAESEVEHTRSLTRDDATEFHTRLETAWKQIGDAWQHRLEGITLAHSGDVVAVFDDHLPGMTWELQRLFDSDLIPCATLRTPDATWKCAVVPAVFRLLLNHHDRGAAGVVVAEERAYLFDLDRCALLLRNLAAATGSLDLAESVRPQPSLEIPRCAPWRMGVFGPGFDGPGGPSPERLAEALMATYQGERMVVEGAGGPPSEGRPRSQLARSLRQRDKLSGSANKSAPSW